MGQEDLQALLKSGIEAAQNNNFIIARSYLRQVVEKDPNIEIAWMWLTQCVDTPRERKECLEQVLRINPNNAKARSALDKILAKEAEMAARTGTRPAEGDSMTSLRRSVSPQRTPSTPATPARPQPSAPVRDFGKPVDRSGQSKELWSSQKQERPLNYYLLAGVTIALLLIAGAAFLLYDRLQEDEDEGGTAAAVATPTVQVFLTWTPTPTASNTPIPQEIIDQSLLAELPATFTPTATATATVTATWTPTPLPLTNYSLLYSGNDIAGNTHLLYTVRADGNEQQVLSLTLPDSAFATPAPTVDAESEPEQEATESGEGSAPEGEAAAPPTATPQPRPASAADAEIEFLDPAYSPDGLFIAFTGAVNGRQEVFLVSSDGGDVRQLTEFNLTSSQPSVLTIGAAWSPNGSSLAFASNATGDFELYLIDDVFGNSPPTQLTNNQFQDRSPAWSPDGNYIAFDSDRESPGEFEVFVLPLRGAEGEDVCQMTDASRSSFAPSWSPDGSRIAFISNRQGGDNDLYVMNSDGSGAVLITENDSDADDRDPSWSWDGEWVAVSSTRLGSPVLNLWLVHPVRREWVRLTESVGEGRYPSWLNTVEVEPPTDFQFRCLRR